MTLADVQEACRALNRQLLDTLAAHLEGDGLSWGMLVVSDGVAERLGELERRCRHRERLLERLGPAFGAGGNRGVRALLTGPSGAGKTLAARILAAELGMDLYRVDLAAVVNKYIGETEKNLHRVLSTAEDLDVVLLLDEGDALLGSRTEVRTANDRYANLETNYLLQRLENYQGIVLITTNAAENIDNAFQRRMDVVLNFTAPQAEERWRIWQLHLPPAHAVDSATLERVTARCALTGGQIRNAAQLATLLALDSPLGIVTESQLEQAVHSEYRKAGATSPLGQPSNGTRNGRPRGGGVAALVDALS
ncbi:MAG: ATP-binding protein [Anaerolineae bacterium]